MSKATILEAFGEGQYAVNLEYDTGELDRAINAVQSQLTQADADLLAAQDALIPLTDARVTAANALDDAIEAYRLALDTGGPADNAAVINATKALSAASRAVGAQQRKVDSLTARRLSLARRLTFLQNLTVTQQPSGGTVCWCADYTEDASGTVPVAITPGEIGPGGEPFVILPRQHPDGYGATYDRAQHGQLVPRMSMTPSAAFYNWAMLPGWQRWMPTFRIGTLTFVDIENDTCNLTLETAKSSADPYPFSNGLNVNLAESTATMLSDVPIRYMTCNAAVFEVGDRVLVRFSQPSAATAGAGAWDEAEVIGFVSAPRQCCFWPPPGERPDAGATPGPQVHFIDGPAGSIRIEQYKGDSFYIRSSKTGIDIPAFWDWDATEEAFFAETIGASLGSTASMAIGLTGTLPVSTPVPPQPNGAFTGARVRYKFEPLAGQSEAVISIKAAGASVAEIVRTTTSTGGEWVVASTGDPVNATQIEWISYSLASEPGASARLWAECMSLGA